MVKTWQSWAIVTVVVVSLCSVIALTMVKIGIIGNSLAVSVAGPVTPVVKRPVSKVNTTSPQYIDVTAAQVKKGDTLSAIAHRNGLTLAEIAKLNPQISNLNLIYPKQRIRVR